MGDDDGDEKDDDLIDVVHEEFAGGVPHVRLLVGQRVGGYLPAPGEDDGDCGDDDDDDQNNDDDDDESRSVVTFPNFDGDDNDDISNNTMC